MVKLFGLLDLIACGLLLGRAYDIVFSKWTIIAFAVYLLLKAVIFLADIGSMFDIAAGVILILSLSMDLPQLVFFIIAGLVGSKGLMSLFA